MELADVDVLLNAHRGDLPEHGRCAAWLEKQMTSGRPFGVSDGILSSFLRIVTHPRIFRTPTPLEEAIRFADALRSAPNTVRVAPGECHWEIFQRLCREIGASGNDIPDAALAALAIEAGTEWITLDRGFTRFTGLRWREP